MGSRLVWSAFIFDHAVIFVLGECLLGPFFWEIAACVFFFLLDAISWIFTEEIQLTASSCVLCTVLLLCSGGE